MIKEIQFILCLLIFTGVPVWVTHYVFNNVSTFPLYISIVMHAALFGIYYGIINTCLN